MMRTLLLLIALMLAGCAASPRSVTLYDITPGQPAQKLPFPILLEPFGSAPSYMHREMLYRLDYAHAPLHPYANSAWRTSPDSMLGDLLSRTGNGSLPLLDQSPQRARCSLHAGLARFEQAFSEAKESHAEVEVNFALVQLRSRKELKRESLHLEIPAATADARGGALALQEASRQAADRIMVWLNGLLATPGPVRAACSP